MHELKNVLELSLDTLESSYSFLYTKMMVNARINGINKMKYSCQISILLYLFVPTFLYTKISIVS